jgi:hypothetical protein
MEGFWFCYFIQVLEEHPEIAETLVGQLRELPRADSSAVSNVNSGRVDNLIQNVGDIHGGITMG